MAPLRERDGLERDRSEEEVEPNARERELVQERHQEAEANEDHHVHILEHRIIIRHPAKQKKSAISAEV